MKRFLSIVLFITIWPGPTFAQNAPTTTKGDGPNLTGQSTQGTGTNQGYDGACYVRQWRGGIDGTDGNPNGGAGNSTGGTTGVTPPAHQAGKSLAGLTVAEIEMAPSKSRISPDRNKKGRPVFAEGGLRTYSATILGRSQKVERGQGVNMGALVLKTHSLSNTSENTAVEAQEEILGSGSACN